jgi:2-polyprenyl-3-methyl-5-hydroxy-6-metoxy-1,4-benzoquinol methylase
MYEQLSKYYNQLFKFNTQFNEFLTPFVTANHQAIDLGCGTGRLTKLISDLGMNVSGIDLDEHMIKEAKKSYPYLEFKVENMLDSIENKRFDLITCFGNTLVHLNRIQLNLLFERVAKSLSKKGYFIIQILNYDAILKNKPQTLKELNTDHIKLIRKYDYLPESIRFETELHVNHDIISGFTHLYPYQIHELIQIIQAYQLKADIYGDLKMNAVSEHSEHIYMVINP